MGCGHNDVKRQADESICPLVMKTLALLTSVYIQLPSMFQAGHRC